MTKASWFLSFLSQQLKPDMLADDAVREQLASIDFQADDRDELWGHPQVQATYPGPDGKPSRRLFEKDYAQTMDLFTRYEVENTIRRHAPSYDGGGKIMGVSASSEALGMQAVTGDMGLSRIAAFSTRAPGQGENPYHRAGFLAGDESFSLLDRYSPGEIAYEKGTLYDPTTHEVRELTAWDRLTGMKVEQDDVTGEFRLAKIDDGEDLYTGQLNGSNFGTVGIFGPQTKFSGSEGLVGHSVATGKYLLGSVYNTIMGTGKGATEMLMASNGLASRLVSQDALENAYSWFTAQAYRPAEEVEANPLGSVEGFAYGASSAVGQVITAVGLRYGMARAGVPHAVANNTLAAGLTLYGANEIFHQSRAYGLNEQSAALIYGTSLLALFGTNKLTGYLTKPFEKNAMREGFKKVVAKSLDPKTIDDLNKGLVTESAVVKNMFSRTLDMARKLSVSGLGVAMGEEALQEALEEGVDSASQYASHQLLTDWGALYGVDAGKLTDTGAKLFDENMQLSEVGKRMFTSAVMGAVGGAAGAGVTKILTRGQDDKVPDMLTWLASSGNKDFMENYHLAISVLDEQREKGELASTKIGVNRGTKRVEPITEKNREEMMTLNDFMYRTQRQVLEEARTAWEQTGLNDLRETWTKFNQQLDFDQDFKLTRLQKAMGENVFQREANWALLNLRNLDRAMDQLKLARGADDEATVAAFEKRMFGALGKEKEETAAAPKKGAKGKKDAKGKKGSTKAEGKKESTSAEGAPAAGKAEEKTADNSDAFGWTPEYSDEKKILRERGLMGLREHYLDKLEGIRTGERMDQLYRQLLIDTQVTDVREDAAGLRFRMAKAGLTPEAYHKASEQLDNLNLSLKYAVEQQAAAVAAHNAEQQANYAKGTEARGQHDWDATQASFQGFDDETSPSLGNAPDQLKKDLTGQLAYGLEPAEQPALVSRVNGLLDPMIASLTARMAELEAIFAPLEEDVNEDDIYLNLKVKRDQLVQLREETEKQITGTQGMLLRELNPRNLLARELYLKNIEELHHKGGPGKKEDQYDMVSGDAFLDEILAEQERMEQLLGENYSDPALAERTLRDINARLSQVRLNSQANRKANEFRKSVLPALVDEQDEEVSDLQKILRRKQERLGSRGQQGPRLAGDSQDYGVDYTQLNTQEAAELEGLLKGMAVRAARLIDIAKRNTPNHDRVRMREDVRHLYARARQIRTMIDRGEDEPGSLAWVDEVTKDDLLRAIAAIESAAAKMFADGAVPATPSGTLAAAVTEEAVTALHETTLLLDYGVREALRDRADARTWVEAQRPDDPDTKQRAGGSLEISPEEAAQNADYVYLKSLLALNPFNFMATWQAEFEEEEAGYIPSYVQLDNARLALGLLLDAPREGDYAGDFNRTLLYDQLMVTGVQGSGKTEQVGKTVMRLWNRMTSDPERIRPGAMDETLATFISTNDRDVVEPYAEHGKAVYAEYDGKATMPVVRAMKQLNKKDVQGWHPSYKNAEIKRLNRTGEPTKLEKISSGDYFYVTEAGGKKTVYVLGDSVGTGHVAKNVRIVRSSATAGRVLALSNYRRQAEKLTKILGGSAVTLPESVGDKQVDELIRLLREATEARSYLGHDLIVYDEATLIEKTQLEALNRALYDYNAAGLWQRESALMPMPLRILYLGDPLQVGADNGLRGTVSGSLDGKGHWIEKKENYFLFDQTPEMMFSFRTGVEDIYEMVRLFREDRFNRDGMDDPMGFVTKHYVGKGGARGMQVVAPTQRELAVKRLLEALGEKHRPELAYIIPDFPSDKQLQEEKQAIADRYGLPITQVYSVKEAQGLNFGFTVVDLEYEGALFSDIVSISEHDLKYKAISAIGRSENYAMLITSESSSEISSKAMPQLGDVKYFEKKKKPSKKERGAHNTALAALVKRHAALQDTATAAARPTPAPTKAMDDGTLDADWLNHEAAGSYYFRDRDGDGKHVAVEIMGENGVTLAGFSFPFGGSNRTLLESIGEAKADEVTGEHQLQFPFTVDGQPVATPGGIIPNLREADRHGSNFIPAPFLKKVGDAYELQQVQRIVQHNGVSYVIPRGARGPEDVTIIGSDPGDTPDLKDLGVAYLGKDEIEQDTFLFAVYDETVEGTHMRELAVSNPAVGQYFVYFADDAGGAVTYELPGTTLTLDELKKWGCPV